MICLALLSWTLCALLAISRAILPNKMDKSFGSTIMFMVVLMVLTTFMLIILGVMVGTAFLPDNISIFFPTGLAIASFHRQL